MIKPILARIERLEALHSGAPVMDIEQLAQRMAGLYETNFLGVPDQIRDRIEQIMTAAEARQSLVAWKPTGGEHGPS